MFENLLDKLHKTWVQALIDDHYRDYAAMIVDAELSWEIEIVYDSEITSGINVYLALKHYTFFQRDTMAMSIVCEEFRFIAKGYLVGWNDSDMDKFPLFFRTKLLEVEDDWQKTIKYLIAQSKELNQAVISEKVRKREGKEPNVYTYNEMKFASKSEIRIAQELEQAGVLFFPLPLAVRSETGKNYLDHREVDFLVCVDGTWGVLEVAYHPDRYEQDKQKDLWLQKSGILCIVHEPAENCYNNAKVVVKQFLETLARFKR